MKTETESIRDRSKILDPRPLSEYRECPNCDMRTIKGMRGGKDSTCKNCGYKDPCCYD